MILCQYSIRHESDIGYWKYKMGRKEEPKSVYKEELLGPSRFWLQETNTVIPCAMRGYGERSQHVEKYHVAQNSYGKEQCYMNVEAYGSHHHHLKYMHVMCTFLEIKHLHIAQVTDAASFCSG
jgi:hypothetical protein